MPSRAAAALDLSGPLSLQSRDAARGLELWASDVGLELEIVDVVGSSDRAVGAYQSWKADSELLVLGPYGSGLVRRVLTSLPEGRLLWNHGGSADDLARPWAPMVPAPASQYFVPLVDIAADRGCSALTLVRGPGRFARIVAHGAVARARQLEFVIDVVEFEAWQPGPSREDLALLAVGRFEDDVAVVSRLRESNRPGFVGCVAAGIAEFGARLKAGAEVVFAPTQWFPAENRPQLGPPGTEFAAAYTDRFGLAPTYVAAQAAAAGYLALAALEQELSPSMIRTWETSTLLGGFRIDERGLQTGHRVAVGQWRRGRFVPV
ncbi:MAG: ABC transporter substrate-binding protein [Acidimicrobiia bacterium]